MTSPLEQKLRIKGPVVVTANRLDDGVVIYRTAGDGWTTDIAAAAVVTTESAARALLTAAVADDIGAVQPYVAPVAHADDSNVQPGNLREHIRLRGPTFVLPGQPGA